MTETVGESSRDRETEGSILAEKLGGHDVV